MLWIWEIVPLISVDCQITRTAGSYTLVSISQSQCITLRPAAPLPELISALPCLAVSQVQSVTESLATWRVSTHSAHPSLMKRQLFMSAASLSQMLWVRCSVLFKPCPADSVQGPTNIYKGSVWRFPSHIRSETDASVNSSAKQPNIEVSCSRTLSYVLSSNYKC